MPMHENPPPSFPKASSLVSEWLQRVDEALLRQFLEVELEARPFVEYACSRGVKRLRPTILMLAAASTGEKMVDEHVSAAVALETIHIASLVHDDILDNATIRRNIPTVTAKWGASTAVSIGDLLLALAMRMSASLGNPEATRIIAASTAEVCEGEILQTRNENNFNLTLSEYLKIVEMKTSALFATAASLGALLAGAPEKMISLLSGYGKNLGVAYQIYDDCVDIFACESAAGKTLGSDMKKGKLTMPVILLIEHLKKTGKLSGVEDLRSLFLPVNAPVLKKTLRGSDVLFATTESVSHLTAKASSFLEKLPQNQFTSALRDLGLHLNMAQQSLLSSHAALRNEKA